MEADLVAAEKAHLAEEIEKWKENARNYSEQLQGFNELMRAATLSRVKVMHEQASYSYDEAIKVWTRREEYKSSTEKKNESLTYLLQRATDALITAFPSEFEDPKAKKKGKK